MRQLGSLACAALALSACSSAPRSTVAPAPAQPLPSAAEVALREQTADQQIRQALNRLTFGPRPGDFERVRAMGVDRWIAMQLDPARIDDHAADALMAHFPTLSMSAADLVREAPPPAAIIAQKRLAQRRAGTGAPSNGRLVLTTEDSMQIRRARQMAQRIVGELQAAKVARAVVSERQLQEVMVDFWENHFNVFAGKGPERYFLGAYDRETIRPYALGKFRDLLEAVAKSPAMLYYLDNWESTVEPDRPALAGRPTARGRYALARARTRRRFGAAPVGAARLDSAIQASRRTRGLNENYGRELIELHTLGVDGGYTQQDVIAAARAFTGWTIARPREGGSFVFRPAMHDAGVKVFLGDTLKPGRGIEDGEQVLDIVARSPATAHFIATKLVRRFVSDSPPPALVKRAAATFSRTDGDIREVLRTIFTSPEFFSTAAYKAKVKSPFELVVSALRAVNAEPDTTPRTARVVAWLGQPLFAHRDPNGYPETGDAWINTGAILNRINFGLAFAAGRLPGVSLPRWQHQIGLDTLPPDQQVDGVIRAVLGGEASPDTRKVLESGENPLLASLPRPADTTTTMVGDSAADDAAIMSPDAPRRSPRRARRDPLSRPARLAGIAQTLGLAIGAPEFQRR